MAVVYGMAASELLSQKERDKGIHQNVLSAITLLREFILSCT